MDPLTQVALGAAIGTVTIGRKVGARRGAIIGGVIAELPDLDVLVPAETAIDAFVGHRSATHSIVMHAAATPVFGEALRFVDRRLRDERWLCWGLTFAALGTHALLDAFTTYGTRLLWPLFDTAISWSSIFIIDPLYTLPLLAALLVSLLEPRNERVAQRASALGIILSSGYLVWTLAAQDIARGHVLAALEADGFRHERMKLIPMPFNSLLWRGVAVDGDRYANVYVSILDDGPPAAVHVHLRHIALADLLPDPTPVEKIARFSGGFYAMAEVDGVLRVRDLRMGVEPDYVFTFEVAERQSPELAMVPPVLRSGERDWSGLAWVWQRIFDESAIRQE